MRGVTSVIVQTHRILRLPRKMTLQSFGQISRKQLNSPNTAPATKKDSHDQSSSHMKRYLQCGE